MRASDAAAMMLAARHPCSRADVTPDLSGVRTPTLAVHGADDRAVGPGGGRHSARAVPGARLAMVEDAGHLCTLEQPETVSTLLRDFITGVQ